jgi:hypothetical protein
MRNLLYFLLLFLCVNAFSAENAHPKIDGEGFCIINIPDYKNNSKYVQQKIINVPDTEDHVIRIANIKSKYQGITLCSGDKLLSSSSFVLSDYTRNNGDISYYTIYHVSNGDTFFDNGKGHSLERKGHEAENYSSGKIVKGTGKFKGVRGMTQARVRFNRINKKFHHDDGVITLRYKLKESSKPSQ